MVSTSKTIVISGYYGFKNSGDEAVLKSILTALEQEGKEAGVVINPVVLSIDPEWTSAAYGVKSVHRMKLGEVRAAIKASDGLISGGGSLLQDATSPKTIPYYLGVLKIAQWLGKPTFIYAQGVGPVNRKLFHPMIRSIFRKCSYISVRDIQSGELLQSMGISEEVIHVVPDPVMGLPLAEAEVAHSSTSALEEVNPAQIDKKPAPELKETGVASVSSIEEDRSFEEPPFLSTRSNHTIAGVGTLPVIGISVRYWNPDRKELKAVAEGLKALAEKRAVHLRFLPFHQPDDFEASQFIVNALGDISRNGSKISFYLDEKQPQDMLHEVSRCDLILGMRLHSLIYAANQCVPLLGISYDPKIDHFLKRLESKPVGTSELLDAEALKRQLQHLLDEAEAWKAEHGEQIAVLKQEAALPARHIAQYLRHRG